MIILHWQEGKKKSRLSLFAQTIFFHLLTEFWFIGLPRFISIRGGERHYKGNHRNIISSVLNKVFLMLPGLYLLPNHMWMAQSRRSSRGAGHSLSLRTASWTRRSRLQGQGARLGQCPSGQQPGTTAWHRAGHCWAAHHPPCTAAITGVTHSVRQKHLQPGRTLIRSSRIPLIAPELLGFYRSAEIAFSLLSLGIQITSPDLPSRSINILGNSTTPNSLSFLCMFHPRNRFPFPPTQGRVWSCSMTLKGLFKSVWGLYAFCDINRERGKKKSSMQTIPLE